MIELAGFIAAALTLYGAYRWQRFWREIDEIMEAEGL